MLKMKGVVPAITTPFREDRSLDLDGFRRLVGCMIGDGVHGLVVNGCTGEAWALEGEEPLQVFKTAVEEARGRVPVVAGCSGVLPKQVIAKARMAETAGCDAIMVQPPYYAMPGEDEVYDFYAQILAATGLPLMVYNIPRRNGINMSVDLVDRLADHPRVFSLKESSKDFLHFSALVRRVKDRIDVFAGYAALIGIAALSIGAVGYVDSTTVVYGRRSVEFYDAVVAGELERARRLQDEMARLQAGFFGVGTFPAGVKAALDMLGRPGGWTRDPIKPLNPQQREKIRAALVAVGLLPVSAAAAE
ncbi:MAG: dihydrodipicolinate synthase family protein [Proteobacteria bacterium]|nr:dihydrodipicolinate synthase family protein [Pseudomonadota bacterium]